LLFVKSYVLVVYISIDISYVIDYCSEAIVVLLLQCVVLIIVGLETWVASRSC
jgi:hypothetical protein